MIIPPFSPNAWSREAAHTLCRASLDAYRDDCGELITAVSTDTQATVTSDDTDCVLAVLVTTFRRR